jgi:hypothetical protein
MFLIVPTFFARCFYVIKDARDSSGKFGTSSEKVEQEYLEMKSSTPFTDISLRKPT